MFQFAWLPSHKLCIHLWIPAHYHRWVPPFGNLRVNGYLLLTAAYRSLSRPSSAPSAKASALCSSLLDLKSRFTMLINYSKLVFILVSRLKSFTLAIIRPCLYICLVSRFRLVFVLYFHVIHIIQFSRFC